MADQKMKISILGTGNMGKALGLRFAAIGHPVFFAGRDPSGNPKSAAETAGGEARFGTLDEAAEFGEVVIWTTRERDPAKVFTSADVAHKLDGKIIVDLNNRDYTTDVAGGGGEGTRWFDKSLGEELQEALPKTQVVNAYNTIAMSVLDTKAETLRQANAQIFIAGGSDEARKVVDGLNVSMGFESVDLGGDALGMRSVAALADVGRHLILARKLGGRATLGLRMMPEPDLNLIGGRQVSQSKYY